MILCACLNFNYIITFSILFVRFAYTCLTNVIGDFDNILIGGIL